MSDGHGVIYILTNPSFPEYVKIGYADDMKQRLAQLNRSECTPFAFRVYATYEVPTRLTDMKIHAMIELKLAKPTKAERQEEETAANIKEEAKERLAPFRFSLVNIPVGAELVFWNTASENSGKTCTVADDRSVEFEGKLWSLSALAAELSHSKYSVQGPRYFKYQGEWLNEIRKKLGV